MREYDVGSCKCGNVRLGGLMLDLWKDGGCLRDDTFFCSSCGTRVGIDERGPWREPMVPRAALMKLAWQYHAHVLLLCASDEEIAESEEVWLEHLAQVGIEEAELSTAGIDR